ncbi:hypothetical protein SNE40_022010 [Patella caerulea]|uniref:Uncharacterized protein n=1 Tax=Patella caerulea TaxID=87958 RepID=A0AAN8G8S0_PATCE
MPPSNTHDVVKHIDCDIDDKNITETKVNKNLEPINVCINHMTNNPENFEIQLTGCKTVGQYAHIETLQVLLAKHEAIQCVFNAMQQFPDKDELHKTASASILQMASSSEANCEMICKCDGISILINTLRRYCDNINVTRTILTIFGYISATEELCFDMIQHCVHSEVMGAMSRHSQDAHVVKQCCFILGNLVITEDTAKQIMLVGGVHTIISVMYKFHDNHTILENGCRALGSFAAFDNSCLDVAQAGGTKTVLSVLEQTKDDVTVQECALWALACLTSMGDTCEELVELDGVDTLLTSIERYGEEETIQEYGVRIICNLAVLDTTSAYMSCNRVLHILIDQLTQYPENLGILDHALSALSHTLLTIENQRLLLNKDGVRKVVEAMATFPEHNGVQEHGCRILGNMGVYEVLRKETEASGASRAVISAMLSLQMSTEIQEYGCMALMNLTADVQVNKIQVMKNGGVSALLTCIRNFENDTCMLLGALKALGNIISLEGVCHDVLDDNGLRTIITVSNRNIDSIEIQTFCSMILCGLSALTDLPFEMTESIDDTLLRILGECCNNADICLYFCQTMENIITTENGYRIFIKDDRLPVILQCMSKFIYHADIQQAGCKIIAILAMGDVDKVIIQNGGIDCISTALELHPTEHRLHVLALMVLASLAPIVKGDKVDEVHRIVIMAMGRFMENHEIQSYGCTAICRLQLNGDDMEVDNILSSVRHALRRHSSQGDVLKSAGSLLRRMSEAGHAEGVDGVLGSALPNLPDFFWRTVKQTKPNKLC